MIRGWTEVALRQGATYTVVDDALDDLVSWRTGEIAGLTDDFRGVNDGESVVAFVCDDWTLEELEALANKAGSCLSVYLRAVVLEHVGAQIIDGVLS